MSYSLNVACLAHWGEDGGGGGGAGSQQAGTGSLLQEVIWSGASYSLKNTEVVLLLFSQHHLAKSELTIMVS